MRRSSLSLPITLGVIMIVCLLLLMVSWVTVMLWGALSSDEYSLMYWVFLVLGTLFLATILGSAIAYLVTSIRIVQFNKLLYLCIDSVTHELKTPLASMKLCLQTLSRYNIPVEDQAAFHERMLEDVERLDLLTSQILQTWQLDAGSAIADPPERFLLNEVLQDVTQAMIKRHPELEHHVELTCDEELRIATGRFLLELIVRNLLDNARKYSGSEPEIRVTAIPWQRQQVVIRVSDNGPGIPRNMQKRIFRRFVRLGNELERRQKGTGLGLYIVKQCVKRLHGKIRVRNNRSGKGVSFYVYLPNLMANWKVDRLSGQAK